MLRKFVNSVQIEIPYQGKFGVKLQAWLGQEICYRLLQVTSKYNSGQINCRLNSEERTLDLKDKDSVASNEVQWSEKAGALHYLLN